LKNISFKYLLPILFWAWQLQAQTRSNVEISGDIIQLSLPALALGSTFIYPSDDKPYWQFAKTYILANAVSFGLKVSINETRPNGGNYSFPSGHTTSAFAGASFLYLRYGWKIGIPAYLLASYVGYTRIYARKHYWWDVAAGATIGIGSALLFVKPYQKHKIGFMLQKKANYYTLGIAYRF